jgi:hypothetical protein
MSQKGLPMKPQNVAIALVLIAGGVSLTVVAERPVIAEQPAAVAEIDFTALHRQASDALESLRRSPQLRTPAVPAAF